jgi:hypothetical protein
MSFDFDASGNFISQPSGGGFDFDADGNAIAGKPQDKETGGFVASVKQGIGSTIKGAGQVVADVVPGTQDNALKRYGQGLIDANPTAVHSLGDIADKPGTAVTEAVGNAGGSVAQMLGARAIGTGITALAPLTGPAAPITALIGQAVSWFGPAAIAALPSYGGIRDKQILNDPANNDDWKAKAVATLGAATVGAIESKFGPQEWALSAMTKEGRAALAEKFAATTLGGSVLKAAAKGAAIEGGEELVQNPIEQMTSYDDPTSKESLKDTAFGAAMGAIGGGVLGGGFGLAGGKPKAAPDPVADILDAPNVDSAIEAATRAGQQWRAIAPTDPLTDLAVQRAGAQWQAIAPSDPQDDLAGQRAAHEAGAAWQAIQAEKLAEQADRSRIADEERERDYRINQVGKAWQNLAAPTSTSPNTARGLISSQPQDPLLAAMREREASPPPSPPAGTSGAALLERQMLGGDPMQETLRARQDRADAAARLEAEAEQQKAAELEAIPAIAAEQNTTRAALQRAATIEAPTALQLALERARAPKTAAAAPAPVVEPVPEPKAQELRLVDRTPDMVAMPRALAEVRAAASNGEAVRIQNKSGKFAYTVIPKAADGPSPGTVTQPDGTGDVRGLDAGAGLEPVGPVAAGRGGGDSTAAGAAVVDRADGMAARIPAGDAEPVATWFGRRGDGYVSEGDARMALLGRQRIHPELSWKVEAMPTGKFRLAGYASGGTLVNFSHENTSSSNRESPEPDIQQLAGDQEAMQQPEGVGVRPVRRDGDKSLPGMDVQLRDVSVGHGGEAVQSAHPGSDQRQSGLRAGERDLGDGSAANSESLKQRMADSGGEDDGVGGLGGAPGDKQNSIGEPPEKRLGSGARPNREEQQQRAETDAVVKPAPPATEAKKEPDVAPEPQAAAQEAAPQEQSPAEQAEAVLDAAGSAPVESLGKTGGKGPAGGSTARARAYAANPFRAFLGKHGISKSLTREFAPGETERKASMVQGYGPIFRASGKQVDDLAQAAVEEGFLLKADEGELYELVARVFRGERITAQYAQGVAEAEMTARMDSQRQMEEDAASDVAALSDASLFELDDDAGIPWDTIASNVSTADAMRSLGFTDQEISDATAEGTDGTPQAGQGSAQPIEAAAGQAQESRAGRNDQARPDAEGLTAAQDDGIVVTPGKGLIKGKFLSSADGNGTPGGPWNTEAEARAAAEAWRTRLEQAAAAATVERSRKDSFAQRLREGHQPTVAEVEGLGLRARGSDLTYFIPTAADLFGISSRAVRPLVKDLIRIGYTDMGAKRESVNPMKALAQMASASEGLTAPTEAEVLAQQQRAKDGAAAEAKAKKEDEQRAQADAERGEFTLTGSDRAADADPNQEAMFKRGDAAGRVLSVTQIQRAVDKLTLNWLKKPDIVILDSMADAPEPVRRVFEAQNSQGAVGGVEGFHWKGGVYIVADAMNSGRDIIRVLYHESLGHFGLRNVFGKDLDVVLRQVAAVKPKEMKAKAAQYGFDLSDERQRMSCAEEILAEWAQDRPENTLVQKAIAIIRTFLRENVAGFADLKLTDAEIIEQFLAPARDFVENGKRAEPRFSRGTKEPMASRKDVVGEQEGSTPADDDYRGQHQAPGREDGAPAHDLTGNAVYPDDIYSANGLRYYGTGSELDGEAYSTLSSLHGRPRREVTIYRAVPHDETEVEELSRLLKELAAYQRRRILPKGIGGKTGFDGESEWYDQAATRRDELLAKEESGTLKKGNRLSINRGDWVTISRAYAKDHGESALNGKYKLISKTVLARDIYTAGDSFLEWGYDPQDPNESPAPDSGGAMFSRASIAGQTSRTYTPEQQRAMRNVGFEVDEPTLKERAQALWQDAGKKLAQGIVDQFAPVKDLDKQAYGLLRLAKGASGAFESFLRGGQLKLTDGVYDFDETKRGGVVDKLLIPLQGEHHDFFRWIAANRAERLMREGKENLFSAQDIADLKTLSNGKTSFDYTVRTGPQAGQVTRDRLRIYADSQRIFNEFNKNALDMAEQSGLIDGASRHLWEHEFYVPFYRVADDADGGVRGMNIKGGVVRQQAFKQLKGGKGALNADLLDNTLMNWAHLLDAAAKNRAAKATLEAAERMGVAIGAPQYTAGQIGAATGNKNGVVWFMDGGVQRFFVVDDPYVLTALTSLEYAGMRNPVMNAMSTFKHALTVGVTASPFFKVRNLIRDSVQVIGTSGINPNVLSNVAEGWKLTDPKSDAYFRLLAGGGTIHFGTMLEGSEAKRVQSLVESGVDDSTILNSDQKVKAFYRKFIEPGITAYNELGNRGEAINRASLYQQLRDQGVNHADASLQARDLMDFSMQGSFTTIRFLTQVVPFLNARLVGMYKLGRAAKEDPARFSAVVGAAALTSVGLLLAFGDDDDWKRRTESDRDNFWFFKFGGIAFRIPKPFEIGAIATLAERGFELAFDKQMTGERFRKNVLSLLSDNLSMNPVPQLVKPILDVYANKDSFSGRAIESMGMDKLKPEYRFNDRTSMTARAASTAMNSVTGLVGVDAASPVQIDHMLRGYFGWLGAFIVGAGDVVMRPATGQPSRASQDMWKVATGGMVGDLRDAPSRYIGQMYEQAKEIEEAYGTWRALAKEGKTAEAKEFFEDHKSQLAKYRGVEAVKRAEAKLNERRRIIERSNMGASEKRDLLRAIAGQQERIAKTVVEVR